MIGRAAVHQANALGSWLAVPDSEVLIFGPDAPAAHPRIRHIAATPSTAYGTPLLDTIFTRVRDIARHDLICFVNGDIILVDGLERIAARVHLWREFLLVGRRCNLDFDETIDFASDWRGRLRDIAREKCRLGVGNAIDYFLFRRETAMAMPAFAIGRPGWDNWMLMAARRRRVPVIDATRVILAIHPNHDYRHVPDGTGVQWNGPEAEINLALARGDQPGFNPGLHTIFCANWVAWRFGFLPAWSRARWRVRRRARRNRRFTGA